MRWSNTLKATTLAALLSTSVSVQAQSTAQQQPHREHAQTPFEQTQQSVEKLGVWAQQTIAKHVHLQYHEVLIIGGAYCNGAYDATHDRIDLLKTYSDTPKDRGTLAHELTHAALDTTGTQGILSHPQYSGPSREELLDKTRKWFYSPHMTDVRLKVIDLSDSIRLAGEQARTRDYAVIDTLAKQAADRLDEKTLHRIGTHLQEAAATPIAVLNNHAVLEVYEKQNAHLDSALTMLHNFVRQPVKPIQVHLPAALNQRLQPAETFKAAFHSTHKPKEGTYTLRTAIQKLETARWSRKEAMLNFIGKQATYFTSRTETLARIIGSLYENYHGPSTIYRYELDDDILDFLEELKIDGKSLFGEQIKTYRETRNQTIPAYLEKPGQISF